MQNLGLTENPKEVVALLSLSWYRRKDPRLPLGMAYIYAGLKDAFSEGQLDIKMIQRDVRENLTSAIHEILNINPIVLGVGVYAWNSASTKLIISSLRELGYNGIIVLGGPEITYGGNELNDEFSESQFFVKGFGELAFTEIIRHLKSGIWSYIPGVYKREEPIRNELADPSVDLRMSPFGRAELLKELVGDNFARWQTQRGCVYRCTFCAFKMPNNGMAESDLKNVEFELRKIAEISPKNVAVLDPVFFLNGKRSASILEMMNEITPNTIYNLQTRFEHLSPQLIEKINPERFVLECGLQTLDYEVQRRIKRVNNRGKVKEVIESLNAKDIEFETHLIYGLPEQTLESFVSDITTLKEMGCAKLRIFPLSLLRGTEIEIDAHNGEITFSPIFPKEVIRTKWMNLNQIYHIKELQKYLEDHNNIMDEEFIKKLKEVSKVD